MLPRPYQERIVKKAVRALKSRGNSLIFAATGAGKTVMLSMVARELDVPTLVLQHRQELVQQNAGTLARIIPGAEPAYYDATRKTFGQHTFAMVQSLVRADDIPPFGLIICDEAHHSVAPTYRRILDAQPDAMVLGVTATPERGDRASLRRVFDNVADAVGIPELVALGYLVPPRAFIVDVGVQAQLDAIQTGDFGEQQEVAQLFDTANITDSVLREWREKAEGRPTIAFCSTVQHAVNLAQAFTDAGIPARAVYGNMPDAARRNTIDAYRSGAVKVLTNCMALTEGFDAPETSCVVLLRKCSAKGAMIQMVGRGLRPATDKDDCLVMDFGTSLLTHGDLMQADGLHAEREKKPGEAATKKCPQRTGKYLVPNSAGQRGCGAEIPTGVRACPLCGFAFESLVPDAPGGDVRLTEIDLFQLSPFRWESPLGGDDLLIAAGFDAWACVASPDGQHWYAIGGAGNARPRLLARTTRLAALAMADDHMRRYETSDSAKKNRRWQAEPASEPQCATLARYGWATEWNPFGNSLGLTKYSAACLYRWCLHCGTIREIVGVQ